MGRATPREAVDIWLSTDTWLAVFPPEFLKGSASNSWEYIFDVVRLLLEEAPRNSRLVDCNGVPVGLGSPPQCGTLFYNHRGPSEHYESHHEALTPKTTTHRSLCWLEVWSIFAGTQPQAQSKARLARTPSGRVPPAAK